jgi:hypothetical protein
VLEVIEAAEDEPSNRNEEAEPSPDSWPIKFHTKEMACSGTAAGARCERQRWYSRQGQASILTTGTFPPDVLILLQK